jgi:dienelactone hydrolase
MKHVGLFAAVCLGLNLSAATLPSRGDAQLTEFIREETLKLSAGCLAEIQSLPDWTRQRETYRRQLQEMLGLWPMPGRTELHPVVTGKLEHPEFTVEKLHFQASPGLYVTANLFIPRDRTEPLPAILYESGHWRLMTNGISYGNKAMYQSDGAWYARNGYVCLVLDTVLAGEIQGIHTGTRDKGLWWWNSRGYTPAGVEAWFGIRALDYLSTRPEVDTNRFGITGHSGGGAYSWMVTALDDRIKAAAPLAGMADARSHILDPVIDSHCDCNFFVNYHRWDFPQVAALAAPRPLLIGGTDSDRLFNLPNTLRIHEQVRRIYGLHGATNRLGLAIAPGGHDEVPELQLAVLRWFDRHLKGVESPVETTAKRLFAPADLKVFNALPTDAINTNIAETFVPLPHPERRSPDALRAALRDKVLGAWPANDLPLNARRAFSSERFGVRLTAWDFDSQPSVRLRLYLLESATQPRAEWASLSVLDAHRWTNWLGAFADAFGDELREELNATTVASRPGSLDAMRGELPRTALAFFAPRGIGLDAWSGDEKAQTRIRRRLMLLGHTRDSLRAWDVRRAIHAIHQLREEDRARLSLNADGDMGVNALLAALFEPNVKSIILHHPPTSLRDGPDYLGILTVCDLPAILEAVSATARVDVH